MKKLAPERWLLPVVLLLTLLLAVCFDAAPAQPEQLAPLPPQKEGVAIDAQGRPRVALNRADAALLDALPGVGPALSQRILTLREQTGGFESVDQLLEVKGIGPVTLEALRAYCAVE